MTVRIAMWSGPRNISTAMMRSFGSRPDCAVSDEPFYGAFLNDTGEPHPMAAEIIADMDCDWHSVLKTQSGDAPGGAPIWYQKHMPHHMTGPISVADMPNHRHAFLIRHPARMVASYRQKNELVGPEALGYTKMREYFEIATDQAGTPPPVVDSDAILESPEAVLNKLCHALSIPWNEAMLSWTEGPHPEDGIWGPHWYDKVNASTGFGKPPGPIPVLAGEFEKVADACMADFEYLSAFAIEA